MLPVAVAELHQRPHPITTITTDDYRARSRQRSGRKGPNVPQDDPKLFLNSIGEFGREIPPAKPPDSIRLPGEHWWCESIRREPGCGYSGAVSCLPDWERNLPLSFPMARNRCRQFINDDPSREIFELFMVGVICHSSDESHGFSNQFFGSSAFQMAAGCSLKNFLRRDGWIGKQIA